MAQWDRLAEETGKAFHAFEHYLELPPAERSIDAAWGEHQTACRQRENSGKTAGRWWQQWSSDHDWPARAAAYDAHLAAKRRTSRARQLEEAQDRAAQLARAGLTRIGQRLMQMDPADIPVAVLDRWLRNITEVELKALGHEDRSAISLTGPDGEPMTFTLDLGEQSEDAA